MSWYNYLLLLVLVLVLKSCSISEKEEAITTSTTPSSNTDLPSNTSLLPRQWAVPDSLITKLQQYPIGDDSSAHAILELLALLAEQAGDSTAIALGNLNVLWIDLDSDGIGEMILESGALEDKTVIVLQQKKKQWYGIFIKNFWQKYEEKFLQVLNPHSPNKIFYCLGMEVSGTGIYAEYYYFHKLIEGEVVECLRLAKDTHLSGGGTLLDQSYSNTFKMSNWPILDALEVNYEYELSPNGMLYDNEKDIPETSIFQEGTLYYQWNPQEKRYLPNWEDEQTARHPLSTERIHALEQLGEEQQLYKAFEQAVHKKIANSNSRERKFWKAYQQKVASLGAQ